MKLKSALLISVLPAILLLSGCISEETKTDQERAVLACTNECKTWLSAGKILSNGPCLLNTIQDVKDWVCDVAHNPRQIIDDSPNNQCSAFREGKAHHFVEVDLNCESIKTW
jgi:hypothetical protein